MPKVKGRVLLAKYMAERKLTQQKLAESIGTTQATISCWLVGKTRPEWYQRLALLAVAGIDPHDWATAEERAIVALSGKRVRFVVEAAS